jgi:hypothetical protein
MLVYYGRHYQADTWSNESPTMIASAPSWMRRFSKQCFDDIGIQNVRRTTQTHNLSCILLVTTKPVQARMTQLLAV